MSTSSLGFRRVRVVALSVRDLGRANKFYGETLDLSPAYEDSKMVGYLLDETILMLKDDWGSPTESPNPRVTIETEDARATEKELRARGVAISDPVMVYDETHWVGSFLDTEGNKIWFCSYTQ